MKKELVTPNIPQEEALFTIAKSKQNNKNKFLVVLPSGIGKTYLSAFETYKFKGRILYLVHRNEILEQAKDSFKKIHKLKEKEVGFYRCGQKEINKKIVFATIQAISRKDNLNKIERDYFDYIILDEWHHTAALTYKRVLHYFKPKYLLGMTATPYRFDGKDILADVDYNIPYQMGLAEGIKTGNLASFKYYGLWDDVDYSDIAWNGHNYTKKDLDKKLLIDKRDRAVIEEVKKRIGKRQTIGFCNSVKHVERCNKKFRQAGYSTTSLDYKVKFDERRKRVEDFKSGKYQIIFTRDIFNEGVNIPNVECLLFLRPTLSKTVFFQQLGRGLRKKEGKEYALVLDFIGNYTNAYKIGEWIKEVLATGKKGSYYKPEYKYKVPEVHFDSRIVELFEMQAIGARYSKKQLIKNYLDLKKKIGYPPLAKEVDKYTNISHYPYITYWGSWLKFKQFVKDDIKEQIKRQYQKFFDEHGRPPTVKDVRKFHLITDNTVRSSFGCGFSKALYKMGFETKKTLYTDVSAERVVKDYFEAKQKLGRRPNVSKTKKESEIDSFYNWYTCCYHYFGSYNNFLKMMDEPPLCWEKITKKDLFENYKKVKESINYKPDCWHSLKLGGEIPLSLLKKKNESKYDTWQYSKAFGSAKNFRKEYKKWENK